MKEPKPRYGTQKASIELSKEIDLPYSELDQDWPWEVADSDDIEIYISHYYKLIDEDKKFLLMEAILQACEELENNLLDNYWPIVRKLLIENFKVHEHSIYYWSSFDSTLDNAFVISARIRSIAEHGDKIKLKI